MGLTFGKHSNNSDTSIFNLYILAISGVLKKLSIQEGWEFFPDCKYHEYGTLNGAVHDCTLMTERPRNWTNGN